MRTIKWVSDGINNTISLGTTLKSPSQIIYVCVIDRPESIGGYILSPMAYSVNAAKNAIVLCNTPEANQETYYIKIIDGLFFTGVQGGTANA